MPEDQAVEVESTEGTESASDLAAEVEKWKAMSRKNEQAAKANAAAAKRLQEFDDRDKTEQQKAIDRADAAEKRAADAETRLLRAEVAASKGLTPGQARRLIVSNDKRELEKDADDLIAELGAKPTGPGSADGGPRTATKPTDMNDVLRRMTGRG